MWEILLNNHIPYNDKELMKCPQCNWVNSGQCGKCGGFGHIHASAQPTANAKESLHSITHPSAILMNLEQEVIQEKKKLETWIHNLSENAWAYIQHKDLVQATYNTLEYDIANILSSDITIDQKINKIKYKLVTYKEFIAWHQHFYTDSYQ